MGSDQPRDDLATTSLFLIQGDRPHYQHADILIEQ
jgi:hypothetical protein